MAGILHNMAARSEITSVHTPNAANQPLPEGACSVHSLSSLHSPIPVRRGRGVNVSGEESPIPVRRGRGVNVSGEETEEGNLSRQVKKEMLNLRFVTEVGCEPLYRVGRSSWSVRHVIRCNTFG